MSSFHTIVLPVRPQPDTIVAIFILRQFGQEKFPGIEQAQFAFWPTLPAGQSSEELQQSGHLLLDLGGGLFDHHAKVPRTTAARLVAEQLAIADNPSLAKLLAYAERDDFYGKGTVSEDPIDRALGLSGLIAAMNKTWPQHPEYVISATLPLIEAHYREENRRVSEFPAEVALRQTEGRVEEFTVKQRDKKLKVIMIESDNVGLAGYLRSQLGGRYDLVVQKSASGHVNILTRPVKRVDLRSLAAAIRLWEGEKHGQIAPPDTSQLLIPGRSDYAPNWYYDPATNSLLNGGTNPTADIEPTRISWKDLRQILLVGLPQ